MDLHYPGGQKLDFKLMLMLLMSARLARRQQLANTFTVTVTLKVVLRAC